MVMSGCEVVRVVMRVVMSGNESGDESGCELPKAFDRPSQGLL